MDSTSLAFQDLAAMNPLPPPAHPYQFRALGLIKGSLKSIPKTYAQATLVASDGAEYPATPGRAELLGPSSTASRAAIPTGTTCSRSRVQGGLWA
jgi:hypothetical protein